MKIKAKKLGIQVMVGVSYPLGMMNEEVDSRIEELVARYGGDVEEMGAFFPKQLRLIDATFNNVKSADKFIAAVGRIK